MPSDAVSPESTATVTTLPHSQSPRQEYPFQFPDQWKSPYGPPHTTSAEKKQSRWQLDLPPLLGKTVKMPQKYRQPTQEPKLPKGWVYDRGRRGGQARRGRRPVPVHVGEDRGVPYARPTAPVTPPAVRSIPRAPPGYELNRGSAYIPFTILDQYGRDTPAQFIQVHMTDNPYALARLTPNGPTYSGEIHAAPVNDVDTPPEELTPVMLRMLERSYPAAWMVDDAVARDGDRSMAAEIQRYRGQGDAQVEIERRRLQLNLEEQRLDIERGMCRHRLRHARVIQRVVDEMVSDRQVHRTRRGNSVERGRSG